jgi:hypothetical protein
MTVCELSVGGSRRCAVAGIVRTVVPTAGPASVCTTIGSPAAGGAAVESVRRNSCVRATGESLTETNVRRTGSPTSHHLWRFDRLRASADSRRCGLKPVERLEL